MSEPLFSPIVLHFEGLDADAHHVDAEQFGKSISGTAKLYTAATHAFYTGRVPGKRTVYKVRMHTRAEIMEGSLCAAIYASMVMGEMAVYPKLWGELADFFVPDLVKAVYAKLVRRDSEVKQIYEKHMEIMQEERQKEREHVEAIAQMGFAAVLQSQDRFLETVEQIADNSKGAAKDSVETIGRTSAQLEHLSNGKKIILIDQPLADALRSKEELEVTNPTTYYGKIVEADKLKKSCKIQLDGMEKAISGVINDPVITNTGNIYTHALDQDLRVKIEAKATVKNNEIKTLYIHHAEEAPNT